MTNKFLKTMACIGFLGGLTSCDTGSKEVQEKDVTPITLVGREIMPTTSPYGVLYFDADGNKDTIEYIGRIDKVFKPQNLANFKNLKIGQQKPANIWTYSVDSLYKVNVRE